MDTVYEQFLFLENTVKRAVRIKGYGVDRVGFDITPGMTGTVRALGRNILIESSAESYIEHLQTAADTEDRFVSS